MTCSWVVPLGGQLDLLAGWLEPILDRPGLVPVPADRLGIVVGETDDASARTVEFEPFDALVGPVRVDPEGIVADVIPVEPFLELRALVGASGDGPPRVVFAHADGSRTYEPIEAFAHEAVTIETVEPVVS